MWHGPVTGSGLYFKNKGEKYFASDYEVCLDCPLKWHAGGGEKKKGVGGAVVIGPSKNVGSSGAGVGWDKE